MIEMSQQKLTEMSQRKKQLRHRSAFILGMSGT